MTRNAAIVQAAVFDAVNGINPRYTPIHVKPAAPHGASRRAAAVQAAYVSLVNLYPTQISTFDAQRTASLMAILSGGGRERARSVLGGIQWGQTVADAIWAWRSTDGFNPPPPPFVGGDAVGQWRPTPPAFAPGAFPQLGYTTPWAILAPSQFRPGGPPALNSARYAEVFNETRTMGSLNSAARTADQTLYALFWNASTATYFWDSVAVSLSKQRHKTLLQNARILGLLNIAMADAAIACWEAKYYYVFWRPVTAIPLADSDGNTATTPDPNFAPLFATPAHPEYPSGHSTVSSSATRVLTHFFGEHTSFSMTSDVMLGVVRSFSSFSDALHEVTNARVFAGIHFRTACEDGEVTGTAVADYILTNSLQPVEDDD
jgi:PAP2 superfamily